MDPDEVLARRLQAEEDAVAAIADSLAQSNYLKITPRAEEAAFLNQVEDAIRKVQSYEDELSHAIALSVIDFEEVQLRAAETAALSQLLDCSDDGDDSGDDNGNGNSCAPLQEEDSCAPLQEEDALAMELLSWFKLRFFSWVDQAPCSKCASVETHFLSYDAPTAEEVVHRATRTEVYCCRPCGTITRFPRYNDPLKLLETRRGRCGEWANCFALMCRAAGLDVRLVLDWTDHVWVEYYSTAQQRWIHADPCEASLDKPLLYEVGWRKKLTYVIAVGRHGVVDVTRRYTKQYNEVLQRRTLDETWVATYLEKSTTSLRQQSTLSLAETEQLEVRDAKDAAEMASVVTPLSKQRSSSLPGRQTGSSAWVTSRGEGGGDEGGGGGGCVDDDDEDTKERKSSSSSSQQCTRYRWARDTTMKNGSSDDDNYDNSAVLDDNNKKKKGVWRRICGGVVRASGENAPEETAVHAFDNSLDSKWLDFGGGGDKLCNGVDDGDCEPVSCWLEYRLLPTDAPTVLVGYALTSANDAEERDPEHLVVEAWVEGDGRDGKKEGKNSKNVGKGGWVMVDERRGLRFHRRGERQQFSVDNGDGGGGGSCQIETRRWRLRVVKVLYPERANSVQLAGWTLFKQGNKQLNE